MAEIISICRIGSTKTNMMAKGNLSYGQLNQFLFILSQSGLIEKSAWDGRIIYRATPKGLEFMNKQQQIIRLLSDNAQTTIINACPW
jgi:predicted transcriptional regulator